MTKEEAFKQLIDYLSAKISLKHTDIELVKQYGTYLFLSKGDLLHHEGMVAAQTFYVVKGLFRLFKRSDNGEEFNFVFSAENHWVNDYASYISGEPSDNLIEALESAEVIAFRKEDLNLVLQKSPSIKRLVDELTEKNSLQNKERLMHQLIDSPQQRYENFVNQYPDLHNRIPLYMIASYLGISRKTLGRIRALSIG